jgi:DNA invertase Pin-like site-specific DNA recombinase
MSKAFAYLRVSDVSQIKGDGFPRQEKAIRDYAKENKIEIIEIFKEEGVSGTKEQRPALAKMMVSLEKNGHGVKTVIIEKLDRLARDYMVQEFIIRDFQKNGFNIISTTEGKDLCSDDPTRKLIRTIMGGFAEYEKTMIVAKLWAAKERIKAKTGKYCGGRIAFIETKEGAEVLNRINVLRKKPKYGKRLTWQQVADSLNNEGFKTMDGNSWSMQRVYQIWHGL